MFKYIKNVTIEKNNILYIHTMRVKYFDLKNDMIEN